MMGCLKQNSIVEQELPSNHKLIDWQKATIQLRLIIPKIPNQHLPQITDKFRQRLHKIKKFFLNNDIKSFIDLGCGGGRSLCFFNKQLRINYFGIEYNASIYADCKKLFQKHDNIQIFNDDFMSFKFLDFNNDCFFINDPLKKKYDFNKLILKILEKSKKNVKKIYFILINVDKNKRETFNEYKLIDSFQTNSKGYYIYSNEKINESSVYKKS